MHSKHLMACNVWCRAWQLLLNLPMGASSASISGLDVWIAGMAQPVPEGVSIGLPARQRQALANAKAWAEPVCEWLLQHVQ